MTPRSDDMPNSSARPRHFLHSLSRVERLLFGTAARADSDEYLALRHKLLQALLVLDFSFQTLFVTLSATGVLLLDPKYVVAMIVDSLLAFVMWRMLAIRPAALVPIAWAFECLNFVQCLLALHLVSNDELRVLWFFLNLTGVYVVLGRRAGAAVTVLSLASLLSVNAVSATANYSSHSMITAVLAMSCQAMVMHAFSIRLDAYSSELHESRQRMHSLAILDPLTGVLNRRGYEDTCTSMLAHVHRTHADASLLFIDLDHFKSINDRFGHATGDHVLQAVAQCLRDRVRKSDIVGRVGGEEFSILLPGTRLESALQVAEGLRSTIEMLCPTVTTRSGHVQTQIRLNITASIGVTKASDRDETIQAIQQRADLAMYSAKREGRNRVRVLLNNLQPTRPGPFS